MRIKEEYYRWMVSKVDKYFRGSFKQLLLKLFETEFYYILPQDENRYIDGIDLRYQFGYENGYSAMTIEDDLDVFECSILEMMVALALRCEERIMSNEDIGDRTGYWFYQMIENLGLKRMDDSHYDEKEVDYILGRFLNREYESNGKGGLFTINKTSIDMRKEEIWYQLMWHLIEISN